jgi:ferric-dicitrate binding protein FerR (iron transport regulator)
MVTTLAVAHLTMSRLADRLGYEDTLDEEGNSSAATKHWSLDEEGNSSAATKHAEVGKRLAAYRKMSRADAASIVTFPSRIKRKLLVAAVVAAVVTLMWLWLWWGWATTVSAEVGDTASTNIASGGDYAGNIEL